VSHFPQRSGWIGDTLWAIDRENTVLVHFDEAWVPLRTRRFELPPRAGALRSFRATRALPRGRLIVTTTAPFIDLALSDSLHEDLREEFPGRGLESLPLWVLDLDSGSIDTLLTLPTRHGHRIVVIDGMAGPHSRTTFQSSGYGMALENPEAGAGPLRRPGSPAGPPGASTRPST
jgi:hypothetical protein